MAQSIATLRGSRLSSAVLAIFILFFFHSIAFCDEVKETDAALPPVKQDNTTAQDQMIIEALRKMGPYNMTASFLSSLGGVNLKQFLPESSTLLVPMDSAVLNFLWSLLKPTPLGFVPLFQYHMLTQQFSFHDLQQLPVGHHLQTLLIDYTAVITDNSRWNFTIDDVPISHPDIFLSRNIAVHGLNGVMNFSSHFGRSSTATVSPPANKSPITMSPLPANNSEAPRSGPLTPSQLNTTINASSPDPVEAPNSDPSRMASDDHNTRIPSSPISPSNAEDHNHAPTATAAESSTRTSPPSPASIPLPTTDITVLPFPVPATDNNGATALTGRYPTVFRMLIVVLMFI